MPLKLYADECVDKRIVLKLREDGYQVNYISEEASGISDLNVVKMIEKSSGVLITEDSDFGEWIFVHKCKNLGVIFLRYKKEDLHSISDSLIKVIEKFKRDLFKKFIVITKNKMRVREL